MWWSGIAHWNKVYINPYSGQILGKLDMRYDWIQLTRRLHQNLLLNPKYGEYIVGFSALFMVFLALTGIYLWIPKKWKKLKRKVENKVEC